MGWDEFFKTMIDLKELKFRRCVKPANAIGDPELILISDGSKNVYAAVAYVRWMTSSGEYEVFLLISKNRAAPAKMIDIVRKELCGATLSKILRLYVVEAMRYSFGAVYHIDDSQIVHAMVQRDSYGFNTFVANRVGEIQDGTQPSEWMWLDRSHNIADWITKGKKPKDLSSSSDWQRGPMFLKKPCEKWPVSTEVMVTELPEMIKKISCNTVQKEATDSLVNRIGIERFSDLSRVINVTSRVLYLYRKFKVGAEGDQMMGNKAFGLQDKQNAEIFWIQDAQQELREEVGKGKHRKLIPRISDGVIVVGGRGERWLESTWNKQSFILLPISHYLSILIVRNAHEKGGHLGVSATVSKVRGRFWVIGMFKIAKRIVRNCVICLKIRKKLNNQIMASLPVERLKPAPPFSVVAVDFFGPYITRGEVQKRIRGKAYGILFTCFVSRAVHVELTHDYTTDGFLQALRRFTSIRGWPMKIHSDPGSQLVGASNELKKFVNGIDKVMLVKFGHKHNMEWSFTPGDAPWMNGISEALIKSVKRSLNTAIGDHIF